MEIKVPLRISAILGLLLIGVAVNTTACGKTYSPHKLLYVDVNRETVDSTVGAMLAVLHDNEFMVKDAGAEHPLTPESREMRRLFVAKHQGGVEVVINNFFTPSSLKVSFFLMESKDLDTLNHAYSMILDALEEQGAEYREMSGSERSSGR